MTTRGKSRRPKRKRHALVRAKPEDFCWFPWEKGGVEKRCLNAGGHVQ